MSVFCPQPITATLPVGTPASSAEPTVAQDALLYYPCRYMLDVDEPRSVRWVVFYAYRCGEMRGNGPHRGCRTGRPVTFSRYSDAARLCKRRNRAFTQLSDAQRFVEVCNLLCQSSKEVSL